MTDGDLSIEEKRVFSSKRGKTEVFIAASVGVVKVDVSDDLVGGFGVDHSCTAHDVAGRDGRIAVATDEDVLLAPGYEKTGFGPAIGVGLTDDYVVAVAPDGEVGRLSFTETLEDAAWRRLGQVDAPRGVDGGLVATEGGVVRVVGDSLRAAGLEGVRDVAAAGPFAATASGLFYLGNGWMEISDGAWGVVDAARDEPGHAHAVGDGGVYRQAGGRDAWERTDLPLDDPPVGFAYADRLSCAVTEDGTLLVDVGDGPRTQTLGLRDVGGIAVP